MARQMNAVRVSCSLLLTCGATYALAQSPFHISSTLAKPPPPPVIPKSVPTVGEDAVAVIENQISEIDVFVKPEDLRLPSIRLEIEAKHVEEEEEPSGSCSLLTSIFNLAKGTIGAGAFGLSAGIATYGNAPSAAVPAAVVASVLGVLSAYCFSLIGRVCAYTGATSYKEAWGKTMGEDTAWIIATACTMKTVMGVIGYSMILGETGSLLSATAGFPLSRSQSMLAITGFVLLPLCWLKDMSKLAPFSFVGTMATLYTALAMTFRYFTKSYLPTKVAGNILPPTLSSPAGLNPVFGTKGASSVFSSSSLVLVSMLSTAYLIHYNAPKYYTSLKNNTIPRFNKVVSTSFAFSTVLTILIAIMGFLTFGQASSGFILNNYSSKDSVMALSRLAVAASITFTFPLLFVGLRDGVMDLFAIKNRSNNVVNRMTVAMLSLVLLAALNLKDLSFLFAFGGASLGNAIIYVFPALMFRSAVNKKLNATPRLKQEVKIAMGTGVLGLVLGVLGVAKSLQVL